LEVAFFVIKIRSGESACTAYVTFKDAYSLGTAVLLSVSCFANSLGRNEYLILLWEQTSGLFM
jgi:hypothetical protein